MALLPRSFVPQRSVGPPGLRSRQNVWLSDSASSGVLRKAVFGKPFLGRERFGISGRDFRKCQRFAKNICSLSLKVSKEDLNCYSCEALRSASQDFVKVSSQAGCFSPVTRDGRFLPGEVIEDHKSRP